MCPQPGWLRGGCLGLLRATKPRLLKQVQPSSAPVGAGAGAASACLPHCVDMAQSTEPASLTQRLAPSPEMTPCCAQLCARLCLSLSLPHDAGAGAHLQRFQAGCLAAPRCMAAWLDFSAFLSLSPTPGVCTHSLTHSLVPLVPRERLGQHQVWQGGLTSSCSLPAAHQH